MEQKPGRVLSWLWLLAVVLTTLSLHPVKAASEPEATSCAEVYIVQANDWLSKISDKFFGNVEAYPVIMTATNQQHEGDFTFARIANADLIEVGWKLCVPLTSTAETILTEVAAASPVVEPLDVSPPPVTPLAYTLDTFVAEHKFNSEAEPKWIYTSPKPIQEYETLPEYQEIRDKYGYRANYLWNEHLKDDYFIYSGIFDAIPEKIKLFDAPWQTVLPRYRYPPNVTLPTGLTTNRYGWRGHQINLHKPPRTIRIAAVGASTTVGGHTLPHAYPEFLEQWLNLWSRSKGYDINFEVINAGREGLNSNDIAAVIRYEVLPLDADYVIYYEGSNQFHPETVVNFPPEYTMGQPPAGMVPNFANVKSEDKSLLDKLSEYSAIAARARSIVEQFLVTGEEPPKPEQTFHLPDGLNELNPDRRHLGNALALQHILGDLDQIKQELDSQNVKLLMTTFNWFAYENMVLDPGRHRNLYGYLNRVYWPISYANIRRAADFQNRVFKNWAAEQGVPLIDVAGLMPEQPDLYDDAIHNTYLGTRVRAWLIFESLLPHLKRDIDNGTLPRPAKLHYAEHPYIRPDYQLKTLAD